MRCPIFRLWHHDSMDRELLSTMAHCWHPIAAPVSTSNVRQLIGRAGIGPASRVLDLGCGSGAWSLSLLTEHPDADVVGVDRSAAAIRAARSAADRSGLADSAEWVEADAAVWEGGQFDLVLCVGASHAFGGLDGTLTAIRRHLVPGGRVILGDTAWEAPPSPKALEALGGGANDPTDVSGLVSAVQTRGFYVSYGHISTLAEWDEYEWCWTGALVQWALSEVTDATERQAVLQVAEEHRKAWLTGYRGELGFVCLVLHDPAD